jgi:hypothetical protein
LIDSTAKSLAEQFFTKFASLMMKRAQIPALVSKTKARKKPTASAQTKKPTPKKPTGKKALAKKKVPVKSRKF